MNRLGAASKPATVHEPAVAPPPAPIPSPPPQWPLSPPFSPSPHHHTSGAVASAGAALAGAAPVIYTRRRRATTSSTTVPAAATDTVAAFSTSLAPQPAPPAPSPPPPRPPAQTLTWLVLSRRHRSLSKSVALLPVPGARSASLVARASPEGGRGGAEAMRMSSSGRTAGKVVGGAWMHLKYERVGKTARSQAGECSPAAPWVTSSDLAAHAVRHCCQGSVSPLLWLGALTTAVNLAEIWALLRVLCGASPRTRALALDGTRRRHQSHAMDCKLFLQLCRRCRRGAPRRSRRFGNQRLLCGAVRRHGHCLGSG